MTKPVETVVLDGTESSGRHDPVDDVLPAPRTLTHDRRSSGLPKHPVLMMLRRWVDPDELPDEMAITVITLAELSAGPHEVRRNEDQGEYDEHAERARRLDVLQRAENEFDPVPFDAEAARMYGRMCAAVIGAGRKPRRRAVDLMIAAIAAAEDLPLFTTNPDDFKGLGDLLTVVPVTRPPVTRPKTPHNLSRRVPLNS